MIFLLVGMISFSLCLLLLITVVNYAIYSYKSSYSVGFDQLEHINDTVKSDVLMHNNSNNFLLPGKQFTDGLKSKINLSNQGQDSVRFFLKKIKTVFFDGGKGFFYTAKKFFIYLLSLTKPLDEKMAQNRNLNNYNSNFDLAASENYQDQAILDEDNKDGSIRSKMSKPVLDSVAVDSSISEIDNQQRKTQPNIKDSSESATLNIASNVDTPSENMGLFEKLENRILRKLQSSHMADYDIWLELGDLYVKYNEVKKAMEIYALVLKHSDDENQKEKAMNKLIGL